MTTRDGITHEFVVHNADGKLYDSSGVEMQLSTSSDNRPSENKGHPAVEGWKMFDHNGERLFFNVNDAHICYWAAGIPHAGKRNI